jgi:hypothetical protein
MEVEVEGNITGSQNQFFPFFEAFSFLLDDGNGCP